jgi:molybdopterin molybdotransferase
MVISVDDARQKILLDLRPQPIDEVDISDAVGASLAEPAIAQRASPPWDCAAMDGIAVALADPIEAGSLLDDWFQGVSVVVGEE